MQNEVERLQARLDEQVHYLETLAKTTNVDTQHTSGITSLSHFDPRGCNPGTDHTKSMGIDQNIRHKEYPSQFERREGDIQTKQIETDDPKAGGKGKIKKKLAGYAVQIKTEKKEHEQLEDRDHPPQRRTLRKYDQPGSADSSPETHATRTHDQRRTNHRDHSPQRRTLRKYDQPGSADSSPETHATRTHDQRRTNHRDHSPQRRTLRKYDQPGSADSSPETHATRTHDRRRTTNRNHSREGRALRKHDQPDSADSSPEKHMSRKTHKKKPTRTTDDSHSDYDSHDARHQHKSNTRLGHRNLSTSPNRHHTHGGRREGRAQKHSPHRHESRRPRTPTRDQHKKHKNKPRDRHDSSDKAKPRHRQRKRDSSDSRDDSSEHSSETDATDDDQHSFNSKTLKLMDKALVRIPYFDPQNKNRDIHIHIAIVRQEAKIRGLGKSEEKACLLSRSLHEHARPWVASLPHRVKNDFKQLSQAVIKRFGEYSTLSEGLNAAKLMTQRADEDPRDYLLRLKRAYYAGNVDNAQEEGKILKVMFFQSLRPEIMRIVGMMLDPETASLRQIESKAHTAWVNGRRTTNIVKTHIVTKDKERLDLEGSEPPENNSNITRDEHGKPQERAPNRQEPTSTGQPLNNGSKDEARVSWHPRQPPPGNADTSESWNNHGGWRANDGPPTPRGGRRPPNQSPYRLPLPSSLAIEHRPPPTNWNRYAHHIRMEREPLENRKTPMQTAKARTSIEHMQEEDAPNAKIAQVNIGSSRNPEAATEVIPEGRGHHLGELIPVGPGGRVHLEVRLQDTLTSQGLCDTGAEISMISDHLFGELQTALQRKNEALQMMPSKLTYSGCEGTHMRPLGKVMMKLTFNGINMNHPLYVVQYPGKELIIGIELLNRLKPIVNLGSRQIWAQSIPEWPRDPEDEEEERSPTGTQVLAQELNDLPPTIKDKNKISAEIRTTQLITNEREKDLNEADPRPVFPKDHHSREYRQPTSGQTSEQETKGEPKGKSSPPSSEAKAIQPPLTQRKHQTEPPETTKALDPNQEKRVLTIEEQIEQQIETADALESDTQRDELRQLLQKYNSLFSKDSYDCGKTDLHVVSIPTLEGAPAVYVKQYKIPLAAYESIQETLENLLKKNIIRECNSTYNSPIWPVLKPTGKWRLTIDYRQLNKTVPLSRWPMAEIDHGLNQIKGAKVLTTMDLANGFWTMPVKETDQYKLAFTFDGIQYTWNRCPFGYSNSPADFNIFLHKAMGDAKERGTIVYVDDILVKDSSWQEHLKSLQHTLEQLKEAGAKISIQKGQWARKRVDYLGYQIGTEGLLPQTNRIEALLALKSPNTVTTLRSFLGICNYLRQFVDDYAGITRPLVKLLQKDEPWEWGPEQEAAEKELKQQITRASCLAFPEKGKEYYLETAYSDHSISSVLYQRQETEKQIIAYASKALRGVETKFSECEKAIFGNIWAIQHFRNLLNGEKIILETNHESLAYLNSKKIREGRVTSSRIANWALTLQGLPITVKYAKNKKSPVAQGLADLHDCTLETVGAHDVGVPPDDSQHLPFDKETCANIPKVYIDGCAKMKENKLHAGAGIMWESGPLTGIQEGFQLGPKSNQYAELAGVHIALQMAADNKIQTMVVCTDSDYVQYSFLNHLPIWRKNGMKNHRNRPIHHRELFEAIDTMIQQNDMKIFWRKVKGHSKIPGQEKAGNDRADALAKLGSLEGTPWKLEDQPKPNRLEEPTNSDSVVIGLVTRSGKNSAETGTRAHLSNTQPPEDLIRMQQEDETIKTLADHIQDPTGKPITTDNLDNNKELETMHNQVRRFSMRKGLLVYTNEKDGKTRWVVPLQYRDTMLQHATMNHVADIGAR
ncbi:uncharacterized protein LOC133339668 [Lethenteron reissneri]|uniref:uncharacterized protein LOC133339668 n=1 Tax=Lethenteron reissneri TaxID=7753 RepID=UPI002AB68EC4|nr:uncharacterized protein LOC133339668 [Lethenteron reissneri]